MKRLLTFSLFISVLLIAIAWGVKPVIKETVRRQLEDVFLQSRVSVAGCTIRPGFEITLLDIRIKRQESYEIKIDRAAASFSFFSLLRPSPLSLSLRGVNIIVTAPQRSIRECARFLRQRPSGPLLFRVVEVSGLGLDVKTLDCSLKAAFSFNFDTLRQSVDYFDARIDSFSLPGLQLKDGMYRSSGSSVPGELLVSVLTCDKLSITDIKGKARLSLQECVFDGISATMAGGGLKVDAVLNIGKELRYAGVFSCVGVEIEQLVRDFDLQKKFTMTGRLSGSIKLQGTGSGIEVLGGELATLQPGGVLVITDTKFIENMAASTKQPVDLLVESFKNYSYNNGLMSIGIEGPDIVLGVILEGPAGKRDFKVVLHKFSMGRQKK